MNKNVFFVIGAIIVVAIAAFLFSSQSKNPSLPASTQNTSQTTPESTTTSTEVFGNPKKSAHYESNTPAHGAILATPPINVAIDFNFDLSNKSTISIKNNGNEYGVEETTIDTNKLSMRRNVDPNAPDGRYEVSYNACWPDGSCHDGNFQFDINRSYLNQYQDLRGKDEVKINLSDIKFKPQFIRVSKGTKLVWINDDDVEHYVNTDSHPAHTYYKEMNSKSLIKGDAYTLVIHTPGEYPYHCSAHTQMTGSIIVE